MKNIGKIILYNVKIISKSKLVMFEMLAIFAMVSYTTFLLFGSTVGAGISFGKEFELLQLRIIFRTFAGLFMPLFVTVAFLGFMVPEFVAKEKLRGRTEFLLANGVDLKYLGVGTSITLGIVTSIVNLITYTLISLIAKMVIKFVPINSNVVILWFVLIPLFAVSVSFLLTYLGYIVKHVRLYEISLTALPIILFLLAYYFFKHFALNNVISHNASFINSHTLTTFFIFIVLIVIFSVFLYKYVKPEDTITTIID